MSRCLTKLEPGLPIGRSLIASERTEVVTRRFASQLAGIVGIVFLAASTWATAQTQPEAQQKGAKEKGLNPDISLNGLFAFTQFDTPDPLVFEGGHDPKQNGFNLQQVELSLSSNVDPYFSGNANLVLFQEDGETGIEVEEAYGTTLALPAGLQAKIGQFFTAFGRNNPQHPHSWHYVNKPLVLGRMFGGDGLRNLGAQLSWLSPLPWFSEFLVSAQNSTGETAASFKGYEGATLRNPSELLAHLRWNNFFALSESLSLNLGASYLNGPNQASPDAGQGRTRIAGGDVYFKFRRPEASSYFSLQAEVLKRFYDTPEDRFRDWGAYAQANYRLGAPWDRWELGLRYDYVGDREAPVETSGEDRDVSERYRISPVLSFYPSEFSKLRFQYDYDRPEELDRPQHAVSLQFEFGIGAHAAHTF